MFSLDLFGVGLGFAGGDSLGDSSDEGAHDGEVPLGEFVGEVLDGVLVIVVHVGDPGREGMLFAAEQLIEDKAVDGGVGAGVVDDFVGKLLLEPVVQGVRYGEGSAGGAGHGVYWSSFTIEPGRAVHALEVP